MGLYVFAVLTSGEYAARVSRFMQKELPVFSKQESPPVLVHFHLGTVYWTGRSNH